MQQLPQQRRNCTKVPRGRKEENGYGQQAEKSDAQYPASAAKKTEEAVETPAKKADKKTPDEPYKDVLAFPDTGKVSLFKKKGYHFSVSIDMNLSRMRPLLCLFDTGASPGLIRAEVLDPAG